MSLNALTPRINLEQSRKQAKDLVKAFNAGDRSALDRIRWNHPRFRGLSDTEIRKRVFVLADAQHVIAGLHHFESWPKLLRHIQTLNESDPRVTRFEKAADAIVTGDLASLHTLLRAYPQLVRERSTRRHRAPLLHYIAANGVEDYRQTSPENAVEVGKFLLDAGCEVDATSEAYGGQWTALGLIATSQPPRLAAVQTPLIDLLLQRGAAIDGVKPGDSLARAALANSCPEAAKALVERGAKVDVVTAAAIGRLEIVMRLSATASDAELERALIMSARYGTFEVLSYLLDLGVDVAASDGMTALHHAAARGRLDMIDVLIRRGAPLEKKNSYGGTVLDSVLWFAHNTVPSEQPHRDYAAVIDALISAGAKPDAYPDMQKHIEAVYRGAGRKGGHA